MVIEVAVPNTEIQKEEKQKGRPGLTKTTSVSVSNEFKEILNKYELSPTEVFRRGVAVTLCDMGVERYNTPMNQERLIFVNKFLEDIKKDEEKEKLFEKLKQFAEEIIKLDIYFKKMEEE